MLWGSPSCAHFMRTSTEAPGALEIDELQQVLLKLQKVGSIFDVRVSSPNGAAPFFDSTGDRSLQRTDLQTTLVKSQFTCDSIRKTCCLLIQLQISKAVLVW